MNFQPSMQQMMENQSFLQLYQNSALTYPVFQQLPSQAAVYQFMLEKERTTRLMQNRASCVQYMKSYNEIKQEPSIKLELIKGESPISSTNSNVLLPITHGNNFVSPKSLKTEAIPQQFNIVPKETYFGKQVNYDAYLSSELEKIIKFLLASMGKNNQSEIENTRSQYLNNPVFLQIFDKLVMKYYSAKKCKEDIIRYIIRRVFKTIKSSLAKEEKVNGKKASQLLCKRYFHSNLEKIEKAGFNQDNEQDILESFMPYQKKSKNRTMNTNFVSEVFSSEEFCQQYQHFLDTFDNVLAEDNNKKMKKLISLLVDCVKKNDLSKLGKFNRLPWIDVWIEDTKSIANDLLTNGKSESSNQF